MTSRRGEIEDLLAVEKFDRFRELEFQYQMPDRHLLMKVGGSKYVSAQGHIAFPWHLPQE